MKNGGNVSVNGTGKPATTESSPHVTNQLCAGEVPPEIIQQIAEDLKCAAQLCSELFQLGKNSTIDPSALKTVGNLTRLAANRLRDELAAAEARKEQ